MSESEEKSKQKIIGGFYIYRAIPDIKKSKPINDLAKENATDAFQQSSEITGIIVIKESIKINEKLFMYAPVNKANLDETHRLVRTFISSDLNDEPSDEKNVFRYNRLNEFLNKRVFIQDVV
jgi:hypothetical protein